jgi:glycosyltransferase involved in cell wall biosynthesis
VRTEIEERTSSAETSTQDYQIGTSPQRPATSWAESRADPQPNDGPVAAIEPEYVPRALNPQRMPRRVLALSWRDPMHPQAGGAEVMLHEHMKRWLAQGHEVTLFAADVEGRPREEEIDGVRIVRRGSRFTVYFWAAVLYTLRLRRQADVVLDVENGIPFFSPLYVRKPLVCLVHHVHRDQFLWEFGPVVGRVGRFIETKVMPRFYRRQKFVAVSESTRTELGHLGLDESQIKVVHNGLDHAAYRPIVKKAHTPHLLYVGRLKRHKRVDLVIELCARLRQEVPDLILNIVGTGDDEVRLRELVTDRGLDDVVHFYGFTSHAVKIGLYSQAWAMVTATEREGWGLSVIEAAACGTPTLSLDVPGVRDAIQHGKTGWLAATQEDLYSAMKRVVSDPVWRQKISAGALERSKHFSWDASAEAARETLATVMQNGAEQPVRRETEDWFVENLVFERGDVHGANWVHVAETLRQTLRVEDRVVPFDGGITVQARVSSRGDIDHISRRICDKLDRFADYARQRNGTTAGVGNV